jgi:hypothetical protein
MRRRFALYVAVLALLNAVLLFTSTPGSVTAQAIEDPCPNGECRDCSASCPGGEDCFCCWGWCYGCPRSC